MNRSNEIAELVTALAKAQGAIEDAEKDQTNPHLKSRYADLASVRAAIRKPLADNGLSYVQAPRTGDGNVTVETFLFHSTGQFISEELTLPVNQNTPQSYGSAITYARRYSLMAILGVAAADDDDADAAEWKPRTDIQPEPKAKHPPSPPAVSSTAIRIVREIYDCQTIEDIESYQKQPEFISMWATLNSTDRDHISKQGASRKAALSLANKMQQ